MLRLIMRWWPLVLSISLVLVCVLTACAKTPPNTNETTSPTLTWKVFNPDDHTTQTHVGDATIHATQGTEYTVTLLADDLGGVQQITLGSSSEWVCAQSDVAQRMDSSGTTDVQNLNPDSQGNVLTSIFLARTVTGPSCQAGWNLSYGFVSLVGTSTNFAHRKTQSILTLQV